VVSELFRFHWGVPFGRSRSLWKLVNFIWR